MPSLIPELKAPDQNGLGGFADGLKALMEYFKPSEGGRKLQAMRDPSRGLAGPALELLGLPGAERELRNLSYGNFPINVPEMTNLPQFKKGRASDVMDLAGAVSPFTAIPNLEMGAGSAVARLGGNQAGAIRIGGAADLVATHSFRRGAAADIAASGGLRAPSIGITSNKANQYAPESPAFVFRAGFLDANKNSGALINRDGYFANPTGVDHWSSTGEFKQNLLDDQISDHIERAQRQISPHITDMRLGQGIPSPSQGLSILASPRFESFREFEKSPYGAKLLRYNPEEYRRIMKEWQTTTMPEDTMRRIFHNQKTLPPDLMPAEHTSLWKEAQNLPSSMAEFKLHQFLPVTPNDAVIHAPGNNYSGLESLRDAGFQIVPDEALRTDGSQATVAHLRKQLPKLAPADGQLGVPTGDFNFNPSARERYLSFMNPGAGSSPPLSKVKPSAPTDQAIWTQAGSDSIPVLKEPGPPKTWQEKAQEVIENADEYGFPAENAIKLGANPASVWDLTHSLWQQGLHHNNPMWHSKLDAIIEKAHGLPPGSVGE